MDKRRNLLIFLGLMCIILFSVFIILLNMKRTNIKKIELDKNEVYINIDNEEQLTYEITPNNTTNKELIWSSSNTKVATVDDNGKVKGVSEGEAIITVKTTNNKSDTCKVIVKKEIINPNKIELNKKEIYINIDKEEQLLYLITPNNTTNKELIWSSSNTKVATVDDNGKVKGVSEGEAIITVKTTNNKTDTCKVIVKKEIINPNKIELNKKEIYINIDKEEQLLYLITPNNTTNKELIWSSSNTKVATVDDNGKVKGVSEGEAIITVKTTNNKTDTCKVIVKKEIINPNKIELNKTEVSIYINKEAQLTYKMTPYNTTNRKVTWDSSNPSVALVDDNGKVKGINEGEAIITVKTTNNKTDTCKVIVKKEIINPNKIELNKTEVNIGINNEEQLTYIISPSNATNKEVTWSSDNANIASVDSNGRVSGISEGITYIYVKTSNGLTARCKVSVKEIKIKSIDAREVNITLVPRQTYDINASVQPKNASNKTLTYTSSNTAIATVSSSGQIKAYTGGNAEITIESSNGITKKINVNVKLNILKKIYLGAPIFQVKSTLSPEDNSKNISVGQGFTVTPNYYVACNIMHANTNQKYESINLYNRNNLSQEPIVIISEKLGHCNDLSYNPIINKIILSGSGFKTIPFPELLNYNNLSNDINVNTSGSTFNSGIDYDSYTKKYYYLRKKSGRMALVVGGSDSNGNPNNELGEYFYVVSGGSQGIGSYNGKILYPHFKAYINGNSDNPTPEDYSDVNQFRNGLDVYRASDGAYLGTYLFVAPINTSAYKQTYTEIEDIAYSGIGKTFYLYYSLRYVFEVELDIPS